MMPHEDRIRRDPDHAASHHYDLVIVGGGIYGVTLALESAQRGMRPLLLERDDFGGATSWASLRIVHGGLRYLQSLDLHRFRESVGERRWFQRVLPDLVRPLSCLMPLYGNGLRKPSIFGLALKMNNVLSRHRNEGVRADAALDAGRILDPEQTQTVFPGVDSSGLQGGGLWHDAHMLSSERTLIELLRWACASGATALNYVEATGLRLVAGKVAGVDAVDRHSGRSLQFDSPWVVTCAGRWSRQLSHGWDREVADLLHPSLAFNLLIDHEPVSRSAVAVAPRKGARTYFVVPWKGKVLAGTYHASWDGGLEQAGPTPAQIAEFLEDLRTAIPTFRAGPDKVLRVYAGVLPATREGSDHIASREVIVDHGQLGGPSGFVSVSGVKYTTARLVAEKTLKRMFGALLPASQPSAPPDSAAVVQRNLALEAGPLEASAVATMRQLVEDESVLHVDDLLLRRMDLSVGATRLGTLGQEVLDALNWPHWNHVRELERLRNLVQGAAGNPRGSGQHGPRRLTATVGEARRR